jgi:chemotaxis methyl-accepting protein methylase
VGKIDIALDLSYNNENMRTASRAIEIDVRTPNIRPIPVTTRLFRMGANLDAALDEAYRRQPENKGLRIISAGCSNGAEADTLLSLSSQTNHETPISLLGLDRDKRMIKAAKVGHYTTYISSDTDQHFYETEEVLKEGGFETRFKRTGKTSGYFHIDAAPVRLTHDVSFVADDIVKASLPEADLVVVNNVMYHLAPDRATQVVHSLAAVVMSRGVLSIGGSGVIPYMQPAVLHGQLMSYDAWLHETGNMLSSEYGFTPLPVQVADTPGVGQSTIFARD